MAAVSPLRSYSILLFASLSLLVLGASSARAQDPKPTHSKATKAKTAAPKHKTDHHGTTPEGAVAPAKPAPAEVKRAQAENTETQEQMTTRGPTRLDFDDRLIQGQGNKVGAVYLYDRKNLPLRSMVHQPTNFREEIICVSVAGAVIE